MSGRRSLAILFGLAAALPLLSCGAEKAPGAEGIQFGFFGALTGPTATFAQSGRNGVILAVEEINAAGGVLGGKRIELLVEDDRGEASEAASAVSKLITRDHVVALIGEQASSRTIAAAPIAQNYRVPMISPTSTNVEVTKKGDYIFRACFTDSYQGAVLASFARRDLKAKSAAILVDARSDYSVGLSQAFRESFEREGGTIAGELKYTEGDSDFSAQLTAIRAFAPDVLLVPGYYTDAGLIARQAKALGMTAVLLGADGWDSPKLAEIGGDAIEGAYFSNHYSVDDPAQGVRSFVDAFRRRFGGDPDSIAALSYDATKLLADAIRRAGSTEGKRIRDALAETKGFAGVSGTIDMDADRNPIKPAVILKVERGRFRFVTSVAPATRVPEKAGA
ncbi:MAG TPA: ABC transporter substrate-binding protein [Thermoanaerobaculia bacterium]|nr:ABC transporter substrate-binding protein [Thermoanaerobaculia bacterium]